MGETKKIFDIYFGGYKITSLGHYWFLKTQIFEEKKGILFNEEIFLASFSRIIECEKSHGEKCEGQKDFVAYNMQVIGSVR